MNRQNYIGGTDAPVIMGLKPFGKTIYQLWEEKITGISKVKENESMRRGKELEIEVRPIIRTFFPDSLVDFSLYISNLDYPFISGNIDGIINDESKKIKGIIEIKTTK